MGEATPLARTEGSHTGWCFSAKSLMLSFQVPGLSVILLEYAKPLPNVPVLPATSLRKRDAPGRWGGHEFLFKGIPLACSWDPFPSLYSATPLQYLPLFLTPSIIYFLYHQAANNSHLKTKPSFDPHPPCPWQTSHVLCFSYPQTHMCMSMDCFLSQADFIRLSTHCPLNISHHGHP